MSWSSNPVTISGTVTTTGTVTGTVTTAPTETGSTWTAGSTECTGGASTTLVAASATRTGLIIYPHGTYDVYVDISGGTASGSVEAGMIRLPAGESYAPLELTGTDAPVNEVTVYVATTATVAYKTRSSA